MLRFPFVSRKRLDDFDQQLRAARLSNRVLNTELDACQQSRNRLLKNVATAAANMQSLKRQLEAAEQSRDFWRDKWQRHIDSINEADEIIRTQADSAEESNRAALDELEALR